MIVIDPMHNLFLGTLILSAKCTLTCLDKCRHRQDSFLSHLGPAEYSSQDKRIAIAAFDTLQGILRCWFVPVCTDKYPQLNLPAQLGRLPSLVGEPAGGSLTADQWLIFATVVAPLAVSNSPFAYD